MARSRHLLHEINATIGHTVFSRIIHFLDTLKDNTKFSRRFYDTRTMSPLGAAFSDTGLLYHRRDVSLCASSCQAHFAAYGIITMTLGQ